MAPDGVYTAWRHHAISWTNVDFWLVGFCGIQLIAISQLVPNRKCQDYVYVYEEYQSTM